MELVYQDAEGKWYECGGVVFRSTPLQTVRQTTPEEEAVFEKAWEDCDTPAIVRREE